jgi:DNA-binding MarR family transcriptional regulator
MEKRKLVRRVRADRDRRVVQVHVTPRAKALLKRLVCFRIQELNILAPGLLRSINACLEGPSTP